MSARRGFRVDPTATPAERVLLWAACDVQTHCWTWLGTLDPQGYSMITIARRSYKAHRVSYEAFVGPIPTGLQIDHLCRNRACVNPEHLEAVTAQVNVRRSESVGARALRRTHCLAGHDYATHGVIRSGRRICRTCHVKYLRAYHQLRKTQRDATWAAYGLAEVSA